MNSSSLLKPILQRKSKLLLSKHFGCIQLPFASEQRPNNSHFCFVFRTSQKRNVLNRPNKKKLKFLSIPSSSYHVNNVNCQKNETQPLPSPNQSNTVTIGDRDYQVDDWTNVTPKILSYLGRNLHLQKDHPLCLIKQAIVNHFYSSYRKSRGPIFAVFDSLPPTVSVNQNFDQLLIPKDHVSRKKKDNYYINKSHLLRAHTTAHEHDLLKSGLDAFLTVGDVYRRDAIDSTHFPVFHQLEGVRLFGRSQLFSKSEDSENYQLFEDSNETVDKQSCHTLATSKLLEYELKKTLTNCVEDLFGKDVQCRWVDAYFPFTHPSYELEIRYKDDWIEMLGCGILRQEILNTAGAGEKVGWAFGLGLERLAMRLFDIPDIRYFWSTHEAVLSQFRGKDDIKQIKFKPLISNQPCIMNDIAFWIPTGFSSNDFYDVIRGLDSGLVENVSLIDEFTNSKTGRSSHCYRLFYRHTSRALTQKEVTEIHSLLKKEVVEKLGVEGRW